MSVPAKMKWGCFLLSTLTIFNSCHAKGTVSVSEKFDHLLNTTIHWRVHHRLKAAQDSKLELTLPIMLAGALSFVAGAVSSAGGIGGGGLFLPILTVVAGFDLKTASSFSAFMVTGGSIANVACNLITKNGGKTLIDYDIALLSEPFMLVGVSIGVICNVIFPEWLITIMFAVFLAWSTFKTFKSGFSYWTLESELMNRDGLQNLEIGGEKSEETLGKLEEPLLHKGGGFKIDVPWVKMGWLIAIWFCFSVLYLFRGNRYGQGLISIKPCGVEYWIISATQIPLAIIFTSCILYGWKTSHNHVHEQESESRTNDEGPDKLLFPVMALLAGALGGVFGIGGGMLISPLLLQVGITPEITAATCSFMVFFSSTMSAFQYLLLGMDHVYSAIIFAIICLAASLVGLVIVQRAIVKHGRASLIVFSVGLVLAVSTVLMTSFGALDVWRDYTIGKYMGFKMPC